MKQNQIFTAGSHAKAVRMLMEQGLSQAEVASRPGIPKDSLANRMV